MKRSPIKRRSARKARTDADYARSRRIVADRAHGRCEGAVPDVCTGRHEHTHHVRLRSQGGSHDPSNLKALCHACHEWAHRNPVEASMRGLYEFSLADPPSTAVRSVSRLPYDHRGTP